MKVIKKMIVAYRYKKMFFFTQYATTIIQFTVPDRYHPICTTDAEVKDKIFCVMKHRVIEIIASCNI